MHVAALFDPSNVADHRVCSQCIDAYVGPDELSVAGLLEDMLES